MAQMSQEEDEYGKNRPCASEPKTETKSLVGPVVDAIEVLCVRATQLDAAALGPRYKGLAEETTVVINPLGLKDAAKDLQGVIKLLKQLIREGYIT